MQSADRVNQAGRVFLPRVCHGNRSVSSETFFVRVVRVIGVLVAEQILQVRENLRAAGRPGERDRDDTVFK